MLLSVAGGQPPEWLLDSPASDAKDAKGDAPDQPRPAERSTRSPLRVGSRVGEDAHAAPTNAAAGDAPMPAPPSRRATEQSTYAAAELRSPRDSGGGCAPSGGGRYAAPPRDAAPSPRTASSSVGGMPLIQHASVASTSRRSRDPSVANAAHGGPIRPVLGWAGGRAPVWDGDAAPAADGDLRCAGSVTAAYATASPSPADPRAAAVSPIPYAERDPRATAVSPIPYAYAERDPRAAAVSPTPCADQYFYAGGASPVPQRAVAEAGGPYGRAGPPSRATAPPRSSVLLGDPHRVVVGVGPVCSPRPAAAAPPPGRVLTVSPSGHGSRFGMMPPHLAVMAPGPGGGEEYFHSVPAYR